MKKRGPCQDYLDEVKSNEYYHPCSSKKVRTTIIEKYSDPKEWKKAIAKDKKKKDSINRALGRIK